MITGNTKLFCIVADPIKQVKTPQIFNAYLEQEGVDAVLVPAHVKPSDLEDVVSGFRKIKNLAGIIVTVPHKIAVVPMCDNLDELARFVGAVNFIHKDSAGRLIGANFDGSGFTNALEGSTGPVEGKAVFIAGAGGVARAIAFNLAKRGASEMRIHNRSEDKSRNLEIRIADGLSKPARRTLGPASHERRHRRQRNQSRASRRRSAPIRRAWSAGG